MATSKKNKYILIYEYDMPENDSKPLDKKIIFQSLEGESLHQMKFEGLDKKWNVFRSSSMKTNYPFIWTNKTEFERYNIELLTQLDVKCAMIVIYDPNSTIGEAYDEAFWVTQRIEICQMVMPFLKVPIFLVSFSFGKQPRDWTTLLWTRCLELAHSKYQYHVDDKTQILKDFEAFLLAIKDDGNTKKS